MTNSVQYFKGHGTKNDFVLIQDLNDSIKITQQQVKEICDRENGIGADGLLKVVKKNEKFFMDYRNADGSIAEMCGNGARVFALFLKKNNLVANNQFSFETRSGDVEVNFKSENEISVSMNLASLRNRKVKVSVNNHTYLAECVDSPNPHAVAFVENLSEVGDLKISPKVEPNQEFPEGVNTEFVKIISENHVQMRVFERGSGETLSCGTGACAVATVMRQRSNNNISEFKIDVLGGSLVIKFDAKKMTMTGPAIIEKQGILNENWYSKINE